MTKTLMLVGLAGCFTSSTPLSEVQSSYGKARLEILASDQLTVYLHVDTSGDCPVLADDLAAQYQGQPMHVVTGGYDTDATGCYPAAFWAEPQPAQAPTTGIARAGAALEIADPSARWNVDPGNLYAESFVNDAANAQIVWSDVPQIETASVYPSVPVTIDHNAIHYPAGTEITWVSATADFVASRCEGPAQCVVQTAGQRSLGVQP